MVITKVFQIKSSNNLKLGLDYIENKEKTTDFIFRNYVDEENILSNKLDYIVDENKTELLGINAEIFMDKYGRKELVSSYGLHSIEYAFEEMMLTKKQAKNFLGNTKRGDVDVLAQHIIQSFSPDDNLTPEEVHEIGRRTVLELTGGEHEFIIATHLDKEHLHNHIIFNTTNNVTLKKFQWKKGTKRSLENISDKHSAMFGAKIIDRENVFSHKKYEAYKKKSFRHDLRNRLTFLIENSNSLKDFLYKADTLNIQIDFEGKEVKYKLLDTEQERNIRDRTLSKKGIYGIENIEKRVTENKNVIPADKIKEAYKKYLEEKEEQFEYRFIVDDWQILKEAENGLYINVEFGAVNSGTILVPHTKADRIEGGYELFIKRDDYFYFTNAKYAEENRYIRGYTLANQLTRDSGRQIYSKNYYIGRIDNLIKEFNYLSENQVTGYDTFKKYQDKFKESILDIEKELNRLDSRIAELHKLNSALLVKEDGNSTQKELAKEILNKLKMPEYTNRVDVEKLISEVTVERDLLNIKFKELINEYSYTKNIEKNISIRKENRTLGSEERPKESYSKKTEEKNKNI